MCQVKEITVDVVNGAIFGKSAEGQLQTSWNISCFIFSFPLPLLHYIELCVYPAGQVSHQGESVRPNPEVTLTKHTTAC